jgi:hypothetical protein
VFKEIREAIMFTAELVFVLNENRDSGIGKVYPLGDKKLLFVGFPRTIYEKLVAQKFDSILNYTFKNGITSNALITCKIPTYQKDLFSLPESLEVQSDSETKYITFTVKGTLNHNTSGRVFAILNLDKEK